MPVAYIEWEDSQTTYNWRKFSPGEDRDPAIIRSVGIVADDCKQSISLSHSLSGNGNVCDFITIPRSAIRKFRRIRMK